MFTSTYQPNAYRGGRTPGRKNNATIEYEQAKAEARARFYAPIFQACGEAGENIAALIRAGNVKVLLKVGDWLREVEDPTEMIEEPPGGFTVTLVSTRHAVMQPDGSLTYDNPATAVVALQVPFRVHGEAVRPLTPEENTARVRAMADEIRQGKRR